MSELWFERKGEGLGQLIIRAEHFYSNQSNRGHACRTAVKEPMQEISLGLQSGKRVAQEFLSLADRPDLSVLDVGSSWGPVVFGAASSERVSKVVGIDIEMKALELGHAIVRAGLVETIVTEKTKFVRCRVESLPFSDNRFDVVICHTVLEHVDNVEKAIVEMYRILKPGGILLIEAPNYLWPYEPHLGVWMFPLGPKWLVKLVARIKRDKEPVFVDHLQFIYPFAIERILRRHGIQYQNIYLDKLVQILLRANYQNIVGRKKMIPLLKVLHRIGLTRIIYILIKRLPLYPSLRYKISKSC